MLTQKTSESGSPPQGVTTSLQAELRNVSEKCTGCEACQKDCEFLRKYGKPKEIADAYDPSDKVHQAMPFECSLCGLCASVCPEKINPAAMFLEMRREKLRLSPGDYPEHAGCWPMKDAELQSVIATMRFRQGAIRYFSPDAIFQAHGRVRRSCSMNT